MHLFISENNKFISCFYSESITGLIKALNQIDTANKKNNANLYCYEKKSLVMNY